MGSSEGIRESERDVCRNSGGLGGMLPGGGYLDHRPIPKVAGGDEKEKEERPQRNRREKENLLNLN